MRKLSYKEKYIALAKEVLKKSDIIYDSDDRLYDDYEIEALIETKFGNQFLPEPDQEKVLRIDPRSIFDSKIKKEVKDSW